MSDTKLEFQRRKKQLLTVNVAGGESIIPFVVASEQCIFVDGVASPLDYMALIFQRPVSFDNDLVYLKTYRFDDYVPFDIWTIVAGFVAPPRPDGILAADKRDVHTRLADRLASVRLPDADKNRADTDVVRLWLLNDEIHHRSAVIELDKSGRRSVRADLFLKKSQYKAALADYNYDLFYRDPPSSAVPSEAVKLYRRRSDALYGMQDIDGAIDSRTAAVRISDDTTAIDDDMAQIDRWRDELHRRRKKSTGTGIP